MKRIFFVTALMLVFAQVCFAATSTLERSTADSQARQSFELRAVDGKIFDVRIVGDNEKSLTDWFWAQDDEIYSGDYFAYLAAKNSSTFELQNVQLFANNYGGEHPQRINLTRANRDGCYKVTGVNGLPDLLVSKIQITGGGFFDVKIFAVKNGRLQELKIQSADGKLRNGRDTGFDPITYLDDGTLSVPWWTNAPNQEGRYVTVYMLDAENLILTPAYTNKIWSPR